MRLLSVVASSGIVGGLLLCAYVPHSLRASEAQELPEADCVRSQQGGLQAYYDFSQTEGPIVKDRSGLGIPVDLQIKNMDQVRRSSGELEVLGETLIQSDGPATKITESVRRSGEFSLEAWIRPSNLKQKGPARIVSLSRDGSARNFTLGQDGSRFDVRLRTSGTSENGIPSVKSKNKALTTELTHVVYTRDRQGKATVYVNGKRSKEKSITGSTANWTESFRLALGNEQSKKRPWLGTYYLVAIYNRSLSKPEVEHNFAIGVTTRTAPKPVVTKDLVAGSQLFETRIAPLLAQHCLECHDANSREGELNLAHRDKAFAGGDSGEVIVGGNAAESLLWELVESDEMPADRPPLSTEEKALLKDWIDAGATWSLEKIDPAVYAHNGGTKDIWLQRLTVAEYIETVRSTVGVDIEAEAKNILPPDLRADGFSNTAYNLNVDLKHVEAYAKLAEKIVDQLDILKFVSKYSASSELNDDNLHKLVNKMGRWLLRGPLEEHETIAFLRVAQTVAQQDGNFQEAMRYLLEAMLQSPRFIYRLENQRGDGTAWPANDYELASRLSYILWGGPPDEELMQAAGSGEFYDCNKIEAQVDRMLADPRTVERSKHFIREWLNLGRLDHLQPSRERFPYWNAELATDMQTETVAFFLDIVWNQKRPLADLLNAQVTFLTPRLAKHYGIEPVAEGLTRYDLTSTPSRGGLLTQGSVLTLGGDDASMVTRGLFVLDDLLRGVVKAPPPFVDVTPVPTKPGLTQRAIAEQRLNDSTCGGCHAKFEPLAFGLEKFDGLGAYHENDEHGNPLRDDGQILIPGEEESFGYQSSAELMNLLADNERVSECLTWKVTQFALGRPLVAADARSVAKIHQQTQKYGGTYANLLKAIVMSDLVQLTRTENTQ